MTTNKKNLLAFLTEDEPFDLKQNEPGDNKNNTSEEKKESVIGYYGYIGRPSLITGQVFDATEGFKAVEVDGKLKFINLTSNQTNLVEEYIDPKIVYSAGILFKFNSVKDDAGFEQEYKKFQSKVLPLAVYSTSIVPMKQVPSGAKEVTLTNLIAYDNVWKSKFRTGIKDNS